MVPLSGVEGSVVCAAALGGLFNMQVFQWSHTGWSPKVWGCWKPSVLGIGDQGLMLLTQRLMCPFGFSQCPLQPPLFPGFSPMTQTPDVWFLSEPLFFCWCTVVIFFSLSSMCMALKIIIKFGKCDGKV